VTQHDEFARRLTTALNQGLSDIDTPIRHRLASIRHHATHVDPVAIDNRGVLTWAFQHKRLASFVTLALLLAGAWLVQKTPHADTAKTDILLLTDDLPPQAYADKKFTQWLN
jgi:hypothetical protein